MDSTLWGTVAAFGTLAVAIVGGIGWAQSRSLARVEAAGLARLAAIEQAGSVQAKLSADAITLLASTIKESSDRLDKVLQDEIRELRNDTNRRLTMLENMNLKWVEWMSKLGERSAKNEATLEAIARKVHADQ